eukprot:6196547-Pleurochrysis_carterae.AAC.5
MEHTKEAVALLKELQQASWLPPYQPEKVQRVLEKMIELFKEASALQKCAESPAHRALLSSP